MILEVDMGNTRLKWRIRDQHTKLAQGFVGIEESLDLLADELEFYRNEINAVLVASVVGEMLEQRLAEWSAIYLRVQPEFARTNAICGEVRNGYLQPQMLGVDRWLGIVAAYRSAGMACVVVSCGTAVTLDLVAKNGQHLGGFIAPGLNLMLDSLISKTRQIKLDKPVLGLSLAPAATTSDAVYSACAAMLTGLIGNGLSQLRLLDKHIEFELILTGGDAAKLLPFYPQARLVPDLVLDGLAHVLDYPPPLEQ
jgi:type III pantothenate kinase